MSTPHTSTPSTPSRTGAKSTKSTSRVTSSSPLFSEDDITQEWDTEFENIINDINNDPILSASYAKRGKDILSCASFLKQSQSYKDTMKSRLCMLSCLPSTGTATLQSMKEHIYHQYHTKFVSEIHDLDLGVEYKDPNILFSTTLIITERFIQGMLNAKTKSISSSCLQLDSNSKQDEEVLMYISGYIIKCIKKKSVHSPNMDEVITNFLLLSDKASEHNVPREWTVKLDRGGLCHPSDDFFLLVRNLDLIVSGHISTSSLSSDMVLKSVLTDKCLCSVKVTHLWAKLCKLECTLSLLLLEQVVNLFLTVRGFAFARHLKQQINPTDQKKGLRKTLKGKQG